MHLSKGRYLNDVGCLVPVRLIGVLEAKQTQNGKTPKNDRLIGIATSSREYHNVRSLRDLNPDLLGEIEGFFVAYNQLQGRTFEALGRHGVPRALKSIRAAQSRTRAEARAGFLKYELHVEEEEEGSG
jgi:inorganic pyrophosphatase